jgi:hypothetical protein
MQRMVFLLFIEYLIAIFHLTLYVKFGCLSMNHSQCKAFDNQYSHISEQPKQRYNILISIINI